MIIRNVIVSRIIVALSVAVVFASSHTSQLTSRAQENSLRDDGQQSESYQALKQVLDTKCSEDEIARLTISPCQASVYLRSQRVTSSGSAGDYFGYTVAISGNKAVVGAPLENSDAGGAYVYVRSGADWVASGGNLLGIASGAGTTDLFGTSVDIDGDTVIVGAPLDDISPATSKGAAYIFTFNGTSWSQQARLVNPSDYAGDNANSEEFFGIAVAVNGDRAVVGAFGDKTDSGAGTARQGSATVFKRTSGTWDAGTKTNPGVTLSNFGESVAISGSKVIVGAPYYVTSSVGKGAAFGYTLSGANGTTWGSATSIYDTGGSAGDSFGHSVSIDGTTAVIGALGAGKAYVSESFAAPSTTFSAPGGSTYFGNAVAISGDMIVVGTAPTSVSAAYVYRKCSGSWTLKKAIVGPSTSFDGFGYAVGADGNKIIVGSVDGHGAADFFVNAAPRPYDREGDGASNRSVFRPSTNYWYTYLEAPLPATTPTPSTEAYNFGSSGPPPDKIVPADFDGDGKMDYAVFRPSTHIWYVTNSTTGSVVTQDFGLSSGDTPIPNDFDGDGKADHAVFRTSTNTWYWLRSSDAATGSRQLTTASSTIKPVLADFDGDGKAEPAVFRITSGVGYWDWYNTITAQSGSAQWGSSGDIPAPGDFDGDLKTDLAVYRPSTGYWYVLYSSNGATFSLNYGNSSDLPSVGDYDADGESDVALFRPSNGTWYITQSRDGVNAFAFGANGDMPDPAAYNP